MKSLEHQMVRQDWRILTRLGPGISDLSRARRTLAYLGAWGWNEEAPTKRHPLCDLAMERLQANKAQAEPEVAMKLTMALIRQFMTRQFKATM